MDGSAAGHPLLCTRPPHGPKGQHGHPLSCVHGPPMARRASTATPSAVYTAPPWPEGPARSPPLLCTRPPNGPKGQHGHPLCCVHGPPMARRASTAAPSAVYTAPLWPEGPARPPPLLCTRGCSVHSLMCTQVVPKWTGAHSEYRRSNFSRFWNQDPTDYTVTRILVVFGIRTLPTIPSLGF